MALTFYENLLYSNLNAVIIPDLRDFICKKNKRKFEQWGGNCCRQSAYITCKYLIKNYPDYDWQIWDGYFKDIEKCKEVEYNHAYVFGKSKDKINGEYRRLLVDMGRIHRNNLFCEVSNNSYPNNFRGYEYIKCISKTKLNIEDMDKEKEYFTGLYGDELFKIIMQ